MIICYHFNLRITDCPITHIIAGSPSLDFQTKDLVVVEGEKMHLPIPFNAVPSPKITWHKDGNELKADDRTFFRAEYTSCHLEIPSCLHADAGQYKVTLENRNGSTSGTINVKVIGKFLSSAVDCFIGIFYLLTTEYANIMMKMHLLFFLNKF